MMLILRSASFGIGIIIVAATLLSAIRTFVLPRSAPDPLTRGVFKGIRFFFRLWTARARSYEAVDRVMALYPTARTFIPLSARAWRGGG